MKKSYFQLGILLGFVSLLSGCNMPSCDQWNVPGVENTKAKVAFLAATKQGTVKYEADKPYFMKLQPVINKNLSDYTLSKEDDKLATKLGLTKDKGKYAGFFIFTPKETGTYEFWLDNTAWVEVREAKTNKRPETSFYKNYCTDKFEHNSWVVDLELKKGILYNIGFVRAQLESHNFYIKSPSDQTIFSIIR